MHWSRSWRWLSASQRQHALATHKPISFYQLHPRCKHKQRLGDVFLSTSLSTPVSRQENVFVGQWHCIRLKCPRLRVTVDTVISGLSCQCCGGVWRKWRRHHNFGRRQPIAAGCWRWLKQTKTKGAGFLPVCVCVCVCVCVWLCVCVWHWFIKFYGCSCFGLSWGWRLWLTWR